MKVYSVYEGQLIFTKILYKKDEYFFYIGLIFFSMFIFAGLGDGILRISNFNNFFILVFVLLSITIKENSKYKIGDKK